MHVKSKSLSANGFTLIELVVGMVVFSVVMLIVINLVATQSRRSIDPIWQVRATELASSMTSEIMSKAFDEVSTALTGNQRCNEGGSTCTASANLGPDGESRDEFDDVDDYHGLNEASGNILNTLGTPMLVDGEPLYKGFSASVSVFYDNNLDGVDDGVVGNAKLIVITVTTPDNEAIRFSRYRWNF